MREYGIYLPVSGLRRNERDLEGMLEIRGMRVANGYWEVPETPKFVKPSGQLVQGRNGLYFCDVSGIKRMNPQTLELEDTIIPGVFPGAYWHFADFGKTIVAVCERNVVAILPDGFGEYIPVFGQPFQSCCTHLYTRLIVVDGRQVRWSLTMGEDIPHMVLAYETPRHFLAHNEAHVAELPFSENAVVVKPMGNAFVVYGQNGIAVYVVNGVGYSLVAPVGVPFGVGVKAPENVDGNDNGHVFLGTDNRMYMLTVERCEMLDYEYLGLTGPVVFDSRNNQWWIGCNDKSYLLTRFGLSGPQAMAVKSVNFLADRSIATGSAAETGLYTETELWTGGIDALEPGLKRFTFLRYKLESPGMSGYVESSCRYKQDNSSFWRVDSWSQCAKTGAGYINRLTSDIQFGWRACLMKGSKLHGFEARFQYSDGRFRRGPTGFSRAEE